MLHIRLSNAPWHDIYFCPCILDGKFFLATGFSACVNAENFDAEIGERMARGNAEKSAENKLWELEGYRLFATNY